MSSKKRKALRQYDNSLFTQKQLMLSLKHQCNATAPLKKQKTPRLHVHLDGPDSCHQADGPSKHCGGHLAEVGFLMSGSQTLLLAQLE